MLATVLATACSDSDNYDGGTIEVIADAAGTATVMLYVSNQNSDDDNVRIEVQIDGAALITRRFALGDGHNWIPYRVRLASGTHTLVATGAEYSTAFEIADAQTRYAVLDYWYDPDDEPLEPRRFTFTVQEEPGAFK